MKFWAFGGQGLKPSLWYKNCACQGHLTPPALAVSGPSKWAILTYGKTQNTNLLFSVFLFLCSVSCLFPLICSPSSLENRLPDFNSVGKKRERETLFPLIKVAYRVNSTYRRQQHPGTLLSFIWGCKLYGIDSSSFCPAILGILTWDHTSPQFEQNGFINSIKILNLKGE